MTTSENGYAFIKRNEGFAAHVYNDVGKQAIGYGHDLRPDENYPAGITLAEADALLRTDVIGRFEPTLNEWLDHTGQVLTQNQYDALIDFAYNLGGPALTTMLSHGFDQIPTQIVRWNNVNHQPSAGLSARRQAEVDLWRQG